MKNAYRPWLSQDRITILAGINNYKSDRNSYLLRAHCQDDC